MDQIAGRVSSVAMFPGDVDYLMVQLVPLHKYVSYARISFGADATVTADGVAVGVSEFFAWFSKSGHIDIIANPSPSKLFDDGISLRTEFRSASHEVK